jgi:hypothetical protein
MKSEAKDCLGLILFGILLIVGIDLVRADGQQPISKFAGGWFGLWSEQGPPVINVETTAAGVVVRAGSLQARIIELDSSHLLCVTTTAQNGKTYNNYFDLTLGGPDQADLSFWQVEPGETRKLNERHEKLYRGH